jgi:uncharacterized membrane-anchored protein YitT (DUF2179 family)
MNQYLRCGKNIGLILLGTAVICFAVSFFILPHQLVVGGISGFALCLAKFLPLSVDELIFLLSWGLFFFGWIALGGRFAAKTLLSALLYPTGIALFSALPIPQTPVLLAALFGGLLIGTGCAVTFWAGGSSGGVDILAIAAHRYLKIPHSHALFTVDGLGILFGLIVFRDLSLCILGILSAFTAALALDYILRKKVA